MWMGVLVLDRRQWVQARVIRSGGPWRPHQIFLALSPRMYRVYGKKNIKLEPVPLKGASLDPR